MNFSIRVPPPKWVGAELCRLLDMACRTEARLRSSELRRGSLRPPNYSGRRLVGRHGAALNAVRKHLCGLRDRCIAAMLVTLGGRPQGRDTKAELNRRSQACDVLTGTGIRVA
jgi:hypothetical protein